MDAGEAVTDVLLLRWLKSKGNLIEAEAQLLDHAEWRIGLGQITEVGIKIFPLLSDDSKGQNGVPELYMHCEAFRAIGQCL